jgi:hypothetical protein
MPGTRIARIAMIAVAAVVILGLVLSMLSAPVY